jgi:microcystin-dependent protein
VSGTFSGTGSGTIAGAALTAGLPTSDGGNATGQSVNAAGNLYSASTHTHLISQNASLTGTASVNVSGSITGSASGSTNTLGNVQPTIVLNYIIAT